MTKIDIESGGTAMKPKKALSIIKEANPLYYTQKGSGETIIKPDKEFLEAAEVIENRLAAIDAIEKEVGCDIAIIFKALKKGIWVRYEDIPLPERKDAPTLLRIESSLNLRHERGEWALAWLCYTFKFSDYGKRWALTKEELE